MSVWTNALDDLRNRLNDGPTDKLRFLKKLIGQVDGSNKLFKSFEFRRVTDFSASGTVAPLGVYVNEAIVPVSGDNPEIGVVELASAPAARDTVQGVYYVQWFKDSELTFFLQEASQWLGGGSDFSTVAPGLRPAALEYAACEAYKKLANKFVENQSDTYRFEDSPDPNKQSMVDTYMKMADGCLDQANKLRDDFYGRQGQANAPLTGVAGKGARRVAPDA